MYIHSVKDPPKQYVGARGPKIPGKVQQYGNILHPLDLIHDLQMQVASSDQWKCVQDM